MKKKVLFIIALTAMLTVACDKQVTTETEVQDATTVATNTSEQPKGANETEERIDYSGMYTEKMGTSDIYSDLDLQLQQDGTYKLTMGLYRVTTFEGKAVYKDDRLSFVTDAPVVEGYIVIEDDKAKVMIEKSEFEYVKVGDVYEFLDGKE